MLRQDRPHITGKIYGRSLLLGGCGRLTWSRRQNEPRADHECQCAAKQARQVCRPVLVLARIFEINHSPLGL
jgi:hypothetical protein